MRIIEYLGIYFPCERWNRWADMGFLIVAAGFTLLYASLPEIRGSRLVSCNHASMSGKCRFQWQIQQEYHTVFHPVSRMCSSRRFQMRLCHVPRCCHFCVCLLLL